MTRGLTHQRAVPQKELHNAVEVFAQDVAHVLHEHELPW